MVNVQEVKLQNPDLFRSKGYINGKWVDGSDGQTFPVYNPATGEKLTDVPNMPRSQVKEAIAAAKKAFPSWSTTTAYQRQTHLQNLFQAINENINDIATLITTENGKPFAEAKGEAAFGNGFLSWFAAEAVRTYGHTIPAAAPGTRNIVIKQPIGVCGLITPWNFPNAMITRKIAPALAAGCTMVIKAPAETPLSALAICVLAEKVGIPAGVINVVTVAKGEREADCGLELCESPDVSKISFTGSTAVGKLLMKQSSSTLKKLSFELGGNAPFIVFDDADLDLAADGVIASKFRASGQTCVCANRIYVHSKVYSQLAEKVKAKTQNLKVGNGMTDGTTIGPLVSEAGLSKAQRHVEDAVSKGAKLVVGGSRAKGPEGSCFFEPTLLLDVPIESAISKEETFGPIAALFKFDTVDEVVEMANDCDVGLAGYFYSKDVNRIIGVAERLQVGMVGVNTGLISQPCIPFGGVKHSGFGKEGGKDGIDEYMIEKLICIGGVQ